MAASDLYLRVREKEGRLYPDDIAAHLPNVSEDNPLREEWQARSESLERFKGYIGALARPVRILELGCGNGWFSRHLSTVPETLVWGLDRKSSELAQAARLFGGSKLSFLAADIFEPPFARAAFDIILLASSIQYFPDLPGLVQVLKELLKPRGELHIMDSPLYHAADLQSARERTRAYYRDLGFPEMASYYFHHTFEELTQFSPRWHYRPDSTRARFSRLAGRVDSPFPWLSIR